MCFYLYKFTYTDSESILIDILSIDIHFSAYNIHKRCGWTNKFLLIIHTFIFQYICIILNDFLTQIKI
ncbi:hypothetical protein Glove_593g43 [Diversispora epigaea]|uniref:Uncharacterized protein n=1 Tax=Diversispora epigaea TaxID=1348612 RepID=A0A397GB20_9GLOM|nr:hypothetical protein Glove_593g43 [Diversispora epigaea]